MIHLFKKKEVETPNDDVLAVVNGKMIPPSQIQDPVFAQEMMGQTIGFIHEESDVVSPVNGIVSVLFSTKHAFGIQADNGNAYLVHIGIDTVSLNGQPFQIKVKVGDIVDGGDAGDERPAKERGARKRGYSARVRAAHARYRRQSGAHRCPHKRPQNSLDPMARLV